MAPKVCYQFQASETCTYGERCKFKHVVVPRPSIERQRLDQTRATKNRFVQEYFDRYPDYEYNANNAAPAEFRSLCKVFRWDKEARNGEREAFHIALVKEFNEIYGRNERSIASWHTLCRVLGIAPLPSSIPECRQVISVTHVNLIDLISSSETITIFESDLALSKYTKTSKKYFPLGNSRAGGFLQYLMRHIKDPNQDSRNDNKGRRRTRKR